MRIDPYQVMKLLGVEAARVYPVAVDCPICEGSGKLELRSPLHAVCRQCHFIGDIVELLAAKRGDEPQEVIVDLRERSLLDMKDSRLYVAQRARQRVLKDFFLQRAADIREKGLAPSSRAIFDTYNCRYHGRSVEKLLPHIVPMGAKELIEVYFDGDAKNVPKSAKEAMRWWGKYTAIAIPAWESVSVVGLWLLTTKGSNYLPLTDQQSIGNGFGLVPSLSDQWAVVIDNPVQALRMTMWAIAERGTTSGFVIPYGIRDSVEHYRCGRTIFWSPTGDPAHYLRALGTPTAQVLDHEPLGTFDLEKEFPCKGSFGQFERALTEALPSHQAVAYQLRRMRLDDARTALACNRIDPADRARIVAYVDGEDAKHVGQLFEDVIRDETITWDGNIITDTAEGWICKGKLISAAKLYIDKIRPQGNKGEAVCDGTIAYTANTGERFSLPFREQLTAMRRRTSEWMQRIVIAETGHMPYIDSKWSSKLIEVAQQFHQPTPVLSDQHYGWTEDALRMPHFVVSAKGVNGSRSLIEGPALPLPAELSKAEWDAFTSVGFCRVLLALAGNLLRTKAERNGIGLMLTNEPHVVQRLANALGANTVPNPEPNIVEEAALNPLPLFTEWSSGSLRRLFDRTSGYRNIVLSVDTHTAKLATLSSEWLQLRVGAGTDYHALRAVFLLLPRLLRNQGLNVDDETFYRDVADLLVEDVAEHCPKQALNVAAASLDQHYCYRAGTAASRIMELIFWGISREEIVPEYYDEFVVIRHEQFLAATVSPVIEIPTVTELGKRLHEARFLIDLTDQKNAKAKRHKGSWRFTRTAWDLNASLMQAQSATA